MPDRRSVAPDVIELVDLAFDQVAQWGPGPAVLAVAAAAGGDEALLKAARRQSGRLLEDVRRIGLQGSLPELVHQAIASTHARVRDGSLEDWQGQYTEALGRGRTPHADELLIDVSQRCDAG